MSNLENCHNFIDSLVRTAEQLFEPDKDLARNIKSNLKEIYDYVKNQEIISRKNSLPELIIKNFDNEQIWQQLELQNDLVLEDTLEKVSKLLLNKDNLTFDTAENQKADENNIESSSDGNEDTKESEYDGELEAMETEDSSRENEANENVEFDGDNMKKSIVDDNFFKLHEMEKFLTAEEKKMSTDSGNERDLDSDGISEASVDLFAEDSEESEDNKVRLAKYKEFFVAQEDEKKPKRNKFLEELSDEEELENQYSTLELRHERLRKKIEEIENTAVAEKPWQLQGEIKGDSRPINSLLEEVVDFDRATRPAPILTGKTTLLLEDIIRQRIKDKVFDSVERKVKPVETPLEYKKKILLDQEKSKASLAQIYEKEYLDQKATLDPESADKEEEEPESHKEIRSLMKVLFNQLDALSNYHYTPKPAIPELKIVSNIPAINMEEVAPVAVTDAALLAPEEVKTKPKTEILGKSERTSTDRNRERRKKKLKQRYHAKLKAKNQSKKEIKSKKN